MPAPADTIERRPPPRPAPPTASPASAGPPPDSGAHAVFARYEFYRDGYRRATRLNMIMGASLAVCAVIAGTAVALRPEPRYFPTGDGCRLTEMVPLNQPNLTDNKVLTFAAEAVTQAHTVRHDTWRADYERVRPYFTDGGWQAFLAVLQSGGTLDYIRNGRVITRGYLTGEPPIIAERGVSPSTGAYTWVVNFPFDVSYESGSATKVQKMMAKVTLVRTSTVKTPEGIGIESLISQTTTGP